MSKVRFSLEVRDWVSFIVRFLLSFALATVPAIVSITNPFRHPSAPLFMPPAIKNVAMVTVVVVPVMWLLGRKWPQAIIQKIFLSGLLLCGIAVVCLIVASSLTVQQAGPLLFTAELTGTIAIPCVSVFGLITRNSEPK